MRNAMLRNPLSFRREGLMLIRLAFGSTAVTSSNSCSSIPEEILPRVEDLFGMLANGWP